MSDIDIWIYRYLCPVGRVGAEMQAASLELTTPAAWRQRGRPSLPLWRRSVTKLVVISPCWGARFLRFTIWTHKGACEWRSPISRTAWTESRPRTKPDLIPGPWCCSWCWCCWWWWCYCYCFWCWWCHDQSSTWSEFNVARAHILFFQGQNYYNEDLFGSQEQHR